MTKHDAILTLEDELIEIQSALWKAESASDMLIDYIFKYNDEFFEKEPVLCLLAVKKLRPMMHVLCDYLEDAIRLTSDLNGEMN